MSYRCFTRVWWKDNPSWPNGLEPYPGAPKSYHKDAEFDTQAEARAYCREWNEDHDLGRYSRKCEFEDY